MLTIATTHIGIYIFLFVLDLFLKQQILLCIIFATVRTKMSVRNSIIPRKVRFTVKYNRFSNYSISNPIA